MTMPKKSAIAAVIKAHEDALKSSATKSWFDRLPPACREEMAEIKREWLGGRLQGVPMSAVFKGVVARCKEESWPAPKSVSTIHRWLQSNDK